MTATHSSTIGSDLRRTVLGQVLAAGDAGFEEARRPWNLAVDQPVAAVVEAKDAADIAAVIGYARLAGLAVTTQPNGHGASGDVDGAILLRTRRLGGVSIDPDGRTARVGAGVTWGEVLAHSAPHGLTGLAGSAPAVSVVGYTLGGGLSWFGRKYGFAADSVRWLDVVTADGEPVRVEAETDPELFWALRGGGGDFAVVTAMEFDLHPAEMLYGGRMLWPATRAAAVLAAFGEVTSTAPDELTAWYELIEFPDIPQLPYPLRGLSAVVVDTTYLGDSTRGANLLRRFDTIDGRLMDTRGVLPVDALGTICAEPTDPGPGINRAHLLTSLDEPALLGAIHRDGTIAPLLAAQVRHLGGALARPARGGSAAGHLDADYLLYLFGVPVTPAAADAVHERQAGIARSLLPVTTGRKPFTYLGVGERVANAFPADVLGRLRDVKRRRDPLNTVRSNFPVLA